MIPDEIRRAITEEIRLRLPLRQSRGREPVLIRPIDPRRLDTVLPQMIVVVRLDIPILPLRCPNPMEVLHADPLVETMLLDHVVAEVPLAEISAVVVLADPLRNRRTISRQWDVVPMQSNRVRVQPRHYRRPARSTHRLCHIRVLKHKRPISYAIQIRRIDPIVAITSKRILPLLISQYEEDVRASRCGLAACHRAITTLSWLVSV